MPSPLAGEGGPACTGILAWRAGSGTKRRRDGGFILAYNPLARAVRRGEGELSMVRIAYAALIAAAVLVTIVKPADAQPRRVQVGTLACSLSSSIGLVVGSQRNVNCDFSSSGAPVEHYTGTMT